MRVSMPVLTFVVVAVLIAHRAAAQSVYKWTDDTGRVHYSDHPVIMDAERVRTQSNTLQACDAACQKRLSDDQFNVRLEEELKAVPKGTCAMKAYSNSPTSKKLALQAAEECKRNYAMQRIDPTYVPSTQALQRHREFNRDYGQRAAQVQQSAQLEQIRQQQAAQAAEQQRQLRNLEGKIEASREMPNEIMLRQGTASTKCRKTVGVGTTYDCN